jgi:hypothetical protein
MSLTLSECFERARAFLPGRRGGAYDPGILARLEFESFAVFVNGPLNPPPHKRLTPSMLGTNSDDLRTIWEFWPKDRQRDAMQADGEPGVEDWLLSGIRSIRTGLVREAGFLGQFRITERSDGLHLFAPTDPRLLAFATVLTAEESGAYMIERTITAQDVAAVRPNIWDPNNPPEFYTGWISLRFRVLGVTYVG